MSSTISISSPAEIEVDSEHFRAWLRYWGELGRVVDSVGESRLFGFENISESRPPSATVPSGGACYGFVGEGTATISDKFGDFRLSAGQWFAMPDGCTVHDLGPQSRVVVSQKIGFLGLRSCGGPLEERGRLKYIDKCSDTLLAPPPMLGDPCLNHLHFPDGIEQTEHNHPSVRSGVIAQGLGWCETPFGVSPLVPGLAFLIPTDGLHRFVTKGQTMDVIAYHPDSDWGPTDENHPMVNRTLVDGVKIDNTQGVHAEADVIGR